MALLLLGLQKTPSTGRERYTASSIIIAHEIPLVTRAGGVDFGNKYCLTKPDHESNNLPLAVKSLFAGTREQTESGTLQRSGSIYHAFEEQPSPDSRAPTREGQNRFPTPDTDKYPSHG